MRRWWLEHWTIFILHLHSFVTVIDRMWAVMDRHWLLKHPSLQMWPGTWHGLSNSNNKNLGPETTQPKPQVVLSCQGAGVLLQAVLQCCRARHRQTSSTRRLPAAHWSLICRPACCRAAGAAARLSPNTGPRLRQTLFHFTALLYIIQLHSLTLFYDFVSV